MTTGYHAALQILDRLEVPVVAAVHGAVAGGGLGLIYVADVVIAAEGTRFAITKAAEYARQRKVWSEPIGAHQGIAHPLAQAHVNVELARLATARAAELFDHGQHAAEAAKDMTGLCSRPG